MYKIEGMFLVTMAQVKKISGFVGQKIQANLESCPNFLIKGLICGRSVFEGPIEANPGRSKLARNLLSWSAIYCLTPIVGKTSFGGDIDNHN